MITNTSLICGYCGTTCGVFAFMTNEGGDDPAKAQYAVTDSWKTFDGLNGSFGFVSHDNLVEVIEDYCLLDSLSFEEMGMRIKVNIEQNVRAHAKSLGYV